MSLLDRVREKYSPATLGTTQTAVSTFKNASVGTSKTSKSPSVGFAGPQNRQIESCSPVVEFDPERTRQAIERRREAFEARRRAVIAMLAESPEIRYAFQTHDLGDPVYIVMTLAIRDVGTCELSVPRDHDDPARLIQLFDRIGQGAPS